MLPVGALISFFAMAVLLGPVPCGSQDHAGNASMRDRFIGVWRLAWLEEPGADGKVHMADCTGLLVFTGDGHMSVQVMYRNLQASTQAGTVQYAQAGYEASFGRYEIDEVAHTFNYHVDGALVRSLGGKDLKRVYEFLGKPANREFGEPERTLESGLGALLSSFDLRRPHELEMDDRIFQKEEHI